MRRLMIAGNWKMNKTVAEGVDLVRKLSYATNNITSLDILVCPTFTALKSVSEAIKGTNIKLGAQNMFWEESGAYTGEISPLMIKDVGCEYVIIGHSERREYFGETEETVNKKLKSALSYSLKPILCIGEKLAERESGATERVLETQIVGALDGFSAVEMEQIIIAYEPIWAIGTGKTATPEIADSTQKFIRDKIASIFNSQLANKIRILYGGSVKPDNAKDLLSCENIDGALVGGASLELICLQKL